VFCDGAQGGWALGPGLNLIDTDSTKAAAKSWTCDGSDPRTGGYLVRRKITPTALQAETWGRLRKMLEKFRGRHMTPV